MDKAAVLDDDGNEVPDGTVGLLGVKTPSRTPGYWKNPRLTASFELNGYWLTGDVARRDAEGNFYHLDRTVDVIDTAAGPVYSLPWRRCCSPTAPTWYATARSSASPPARRGASSPIAVVQLQADAADWTAEAILEKANKELAAAGLRRARRGDHRSDAGGLPARPDRQGAQARAAHPVRRRVLQPEQVGATTEGSGATHRRSLVS